MNNLNNTLMIAPNIEVPITFQDVKIELIIGWKPPEKTKEESILIYPIPILVDYDGTYELIQPQSTWAVDVANTSYNKLQALVINGHENIKVISLLKSIHTNRAHFNREEIKDQLLNNKTLKQHIKKAYNIDNPATEMNNLLGCKLYSSRQLNRFTSCKAAKNNSSIQKEALTLANDDEKIDTVKQSIPEKTEPSSLADRGMVDTAEQPILKEKSVTPSFEKITIKDWNKFAEETKDVWPLHTIVEKSDRSVKYILERINEMLSENGGDFTKVWELIYQKLGIKS